MGYPTEDQVLAGVVFGESDELTGNVVLPDVNDVLDGVEFGPEGNSLTGSFVTVASSDVKSGAPYGVNGAEVGTLTLPSVGEVLSGVQFGSDNELTGTYDAPLPGQVLSEVPYGNPDNISFGTFVYPAEADVKLGVMYGENASQFTGDYSGGGGGGTSFIGRGVGMGVPLGYSQLSISGADNLGNATIPNGANAVSVQPSSDIRVNAAGGVANATYGSLIPADAEVTVYSGRELTAAIMADIKVCPVSSSATLNVNFFNTPKLYRDF